MMEAYCHEVSLDFYEGMLHWGDVEGQRKAAEMFKKFDGWHDDALDSSGFRPRENSVC